MAAESGARTIHAAWEFHPWVTETMAEGARARDALTIQDWCGVRVEEATVLLHPLHKHPMRALQDENLDGREKERERERERARERE